MGTNAVQRDATAETVSANVKRLRTKQNLGLRGLSTKLGEVGRPLGHSAVDQIEKGTRRVDVDDLMALAVALEVSPRRYCMPYAENADDQVRDDRSAMDAFEAWSGCAEAGCSRGHIGGRHYRRCVPQSSWRRDGVAAR